MLNILDPDQAQQNVGPDLGPNCWQRLSTEDTSRQRVKGKASLLYFLVLVNLYMLFVSIDCDI